MVRRLAEAGHLSAELLSGGDPGRILEKILRDSGPDSVKELRVMDLPEFGRDIHAEMSAISDAARIGVPIKDSDTLFNYFSMPHLR